MPYQKLTFKPGIYKDDSPLEAEGYWIDADKIRFVRGLPETIYGWEKASNSNLTGICRGIYTWADNGRNPYAAFGTHLRLQVIDVDGNLTDVTPVVSRGTLGSNPFTTVNASSSVTVTHTSHGLAANQLAGFSNAATFNNVAISGPYVVQSVTDANNYVITATTTANASGSGGGASVYYTYSLAPGQTDGLGGLGYGTGAYGIGGFGGSQSGFTLYPRSWSFAWWGQNLIANPRGGGIYEWAPNVTATELISDTTMATGWTPGTGWSIAAGVATASASLSGLTSTIVLPLDAWCLLQFDATRTSGSVQASVAGTNIGSAVSSSGHKFITFNSGVGGSASLAFTGAGPFSGTISNPSVKVLTTANALPGAPSQTTCIFSTSQRILVACGVPTDIATRFDGSFDPMKVAWTDAQNNQTWTPAASNVAGGYTLTAGSRIVRGVPGTNFNLILTDIAAYVMRYTGETGQVYDFTQVGSGCGLIGPNAITQVNGLFFWMSPDGQYYVFDGSIPRALTSTVRNYVKDNISWVQQDKVYAISVASRNEVWWLYPDQRDGNECSRYVIYNFVEDHWSIGTFDRTAWIDSGVYEFPLSADSSGGIWFQEKGFTQDGGARSWSLMSAIADMGTDGAQLRIRSFLPDAANLLGNYIVSFTSYIKNSSGITSRNFGPYSVTAVSGKISARANAQDISISFSGNGAPTSWRLGQIRFEVEPSMRSR